MHSRRSWIRLAAAAICFVSTCEAVAAESPAHTAQDDRSWAFRPVHKPTPPRVRNESWVLGGFGLLLLGAAISWNKHRLRGLAGRRVQSPPAGVASLPVGRGAD